jgi:arginase
VRDDLDGFWIHLDVDAPGDAIMPAVDYRLPGGLSWDELVSLLSVALASDRAVGLEVTIFNPSLHHDGSVARALVAALARAFGT